MSVTDGSGLVEKFERSSQRSGSGGEGVDEQAEQWRFYDLMSSLEAIFTYKSGWSKYYKHNV